MSHVRQEPPFVKQTLPIESNVMYVTCEIGTSICKTNTANKK